MFRYFNVLAPVLGDNCVYADVGSAPGDATWQPFMDKDPDMCRLKYNQVCNLCYRAFGQLYTVFCRRLLCKFQRLQHSNESALIRRAARRQPPPPG